ncbi:MAG: M48 family metalloprotease [Cyclobacteriaceae bacterium]
MNRIRILTLGVMLAGFSLFMSCDKNGDFLLFSIQNDIDLGFQMDMEIEADPTNFPILDRTQYADAYDYLDDMVLEILDNADISYREEFAWEVHIIDQDVLNAFVTPGGYIYVYNGLIQYLDTADDLAGVIGHEIAHADQRHGSKQLQREYGISLLLNIILGDDPSALEAIVAQVAAVGGSLKFSRAAESEADAFSVEYLAQTHYACDGAASFFQKLIDQGQSGGIPEFLSNHPNPDNRVANIQAKAAQVDCSTDLYLDSPSAGCGGDTEYECFKEDYLPDLTPA